MTKKGQKHIVKDLPGKSVYLSNDQWIELAQFLNYHSKDLPEITTKDHALHKLREMANQVKEDREIVEAGQEAIDEANGVL